jgi:hypothetical protein
MARVPGKSSDICDPAPGKRAGAVHWKKLGKILWQITQLTDLEELAGTSFVQ